MGVAAPRVVVFVRLVGLVSHLVLVVRVALVPTRVEQTTAFLFAPLGLNV